MEDINDINIKVPSWAEDIKDEGLIVFIALLTKISYRYGFDDYYNFHVPDVNKVKGSLENIRKLIDPYKEWIEYAQPYNNEIQFRMKRVFKHHLVSYPMKDARHIRVWCYLLGCMNNNMLDKEHYGARPPQSSAFTNENEHQLFRSYGI